MYERDGQTHTDRRTLHDNIGRAIPIQSIARQSKNSMLAEIASHTLTKATLAHFYLPALFEKTYFYVLFFKIQKRVFTFS